MMNKKTFVSLILALLSTGVWFVFFPPPSISLALISGFILVPVLFTMFYLITAQSPKTSTISSFDEDSRPDTQVSQVTTTTTTDSHDIPLPPLPAFTRTAALPFRELAEIPPFTGMKDDTPPSYRSVYLERVQRS